MRRYLLHLLDDWLDFRYAELKSLLEQQELTLGEVIEVPSTFQPIDKKNVTNSSAFNYHTNDLVELPSFSENFTEKEYKQYRAEHYLQYLRNLPKPSHFLTVYLPSDDYAIRLCDKSVLVKAAYQLWASSPSFQGAIDQMKVVYEASKQNSEDTSSSTISGITSSELASLLQDSSLTWSIRLDTFAKTCTMKEKEEFRNHFKFLDFIGNVNINSPSLSLWLILDYSAEQPLPRPSRQLLTSLKEEKQDETDGITSSLNQIVLDETLKGYVGSLSLNEIPTYFCRQVATNAVMKKNHQKYSLKIRPYLGPTSLDDNLAFILCNIAMVKPEIKKIKNENNETIIESKKNPYIALEPFMGTGSIALALTHCGSFCMGFDIDPRVLRGDMFAGKNKDTNKPEKKVKKTPFLKENANVPKELTPTGFPRDVMGNFLHYNLPLPELIRMDHHVLDRHFYWSPTSIADGFYDVIVTDPPYGIRAGAKKSGRKRQIKKEGEDELDEKYECEYTIDPERRADHVPSTQNYPVDEVMLDLMHTAARALKNNGRLIYLLPTPYDFTVNDLPTHPCLELIEICHQPLSTRHGRRAVVMKKVSEYTSEKLEQFKEYKRKVLSGKDTGFGLLMTKLVAALANDAFENENVVKRMGACSERRRTSKMERRAKHKNKDENKDENKDNSTTSSTTITTNSENNINEEENFTRC